MADSVNGINKKRLEQIIFKLSCPEFACQKSIQYGNKCEKKVRPSPRSSKLFKRNQVNRLPNKLLVVKYVINQNTKSIYFKAI